MCVNNLPRVALNSWAAKNRTRDLLMASTAPYRQATEPSESRQTELKKESKKWRRQQTFVIVLDVGQIEAMWRYDVDVLGLIRSIIGQINRAVGLLEHSSHVVDADNATSSCHHHSHHPPYLYTAISLSLSVLTATFPMDLDNGVPRIFHWGQDRRAKGREQGVGFLGRGAATLSHQIGGLGERCELPQLGSGRSPDCPKVFHYFQHSGWPLLVLVFWYRLTQIHLENSR